MKNFSFQYDVAYNFEDGFMEKLGEIGNVHSVYAKLNSDIVGGGRPSDSLPMISYKSLEEHIQKAHKEGIKFNYLLNSVCMSNNELEKEWFFEMQNYLDQLVEMGVDSVTVANPLLSDMIRHRYPDLEICLSVNVRVHTIQQIKYWEDFGVNEITMDQIVNRDFEYLESILNYTKNTNTRIRLFANNLCLHDCPIRTYHGLANAHASQNNSMKKEHLNYYYYKCTEMKMKEPSKLLSATWIRPDDLPYYKDLVKKTGNENIILKLVERSSTSDYLIRVLSAYKEEHFDGNLMDLIYAIQSKYLLPPKGKEQYHYYSPEILKKIRSLFQLDWFYIDNRKLDGFIEHFVNNNGCKHSVCASKKINSESCTYCYAWAQKAITYDEKAHKEYLDNLAEIMNGIQSGDIFV